MRVHVIAVGLLLSEIAWRSFLRFFIIIDGVVGAWVFFARSPVVLGLLIRWVVGLFVVWPVSCGLPVVLAAGGCYVHGLCVTILTFLFLGAWRDDDPEKWVFITRALFRYKGTFLLEFLHVEVF